MARVVVNTLGGTETETEGVVNMDARLDGPIVV